MLEASLNPFLKQIRESYISEEEKKELESIFSFIIREALYTIGAEKGNLYYLNKDKLIVGIKDHNLEDEDFSFKISQKVIQEKKDQHIAKNQYIADFDHVTKETYMVCYLGDKSEEGTLGAFLVEGLKNFENFSDNDFKLFRLFCENLVTLLYNAHYSKEFSEFYLKFTTSLVLLNHASSNQQKNSRLEFLLKEVIRVTGLINSSRNLTTLLKEVMESVKSVFQTESCSIMLVDKEKKDLYFHIVAGEKEAEISKIRVPLGVGIAGTVAITRKPMIINDAQNDDRVYKAVDKASAFVTRNILAAALVVDDEVIGIMEAINTIDRNNFNEADIDLFLSFSDAAAVAIQRTRLLENLEKTNTELQKRLSELESLFDLGQAVLESRGEEELIFKSLRIVTREMNAKRAAVVILNAKTELLNILYIIGNEEYQEKLSFLRDSIILHSIIGNKIVLKNEKSSIQDFDALDEKILVGSFIILPLNDRDKKPFGAICVSDRKDFIQYEQGHLRLLQTISAQLIKGYENIKLNQDIIAKKAIEKEIEITRNIQKNILPSKLPSGSNFEIGVKSVPAKEVSGDFYDFYKYEDGQYSFLIADVSGKSLPAAIFMAMSSSVMRTLGRNHEYRPDELLKRANALIYEDSESGMFVTLFFIHYNPSISEVEFASAGHNDQIWIKNDGHYEIIKGKGPPLGVVPSVDYIGGKMKPSSGDLIVLYTDGAIEQEDKSKVEFGLDRLVEEIIKRREKPSQTIAEEIYDLIMEYADGSEQFDDFTLLILKFNDDYQFKRVFPANNASIPKFRDFVYDTIKIRNLDATLNDDILLCADEAATNVVMHAYDNMDKNPTFECYMKFVDDTMSILIKNRGKPFDRNKVLEPSIHANLKGERKGGFGIYLIEKLMDKVTYYSDSGINHILIEKKIK
ncbi:MAG: SpoIIE family protein phosphatase [Leptospiraceae bacterium]|nr:SpoIIE family protein phosphatase [Leptospiraceae bacterium]MCP5494144.1 SpoIIE family protein phosphatase [Leptospiraceae bacterium]